MPPRQPDPRYVFIDHLPDPQMLTTSHRLQLAGLASESGFPICSAPDLVQIATPSSSHPRSGPLEHFISSESMSSSPKASASAPSVTRKTYSHKHKGKGKARASMAPELEEDIESFSSDSDCIKVITSKAPCTKARCIERNPNCLKYMGQDKWLNHGASLRVPLLHP